MFNRKLIFLTAVLTVFLPVLAFADGAVDLPQTGQTKCYDTAGAEILCTGTGQDGEIQAGVAWPEPRFIVDGDCVIDNLTGLMWARDGNLTGYMKWNPAIDYANNLTLCGYSDWRLPNINELDSLMNADVSNTAIWLNGQGFTNVQSNDYWSSTTGTFYTGGAWVKAMGWHGYGVLGDKYGNFYVWPVRSGQSGIISLPKTGQTTSYREGDDGDLEMGVAWPSPRFTDNGNGTVTDNLTGLMWLKDTNCIKTNYPAFDSDGAVTWQNALDFVKGINNGTYSQCGAGYSDWRLPNRKELRSLIDYSRYGPVLPAGHPFTNVQSVYYHWSSTTYAYYTYKAWMVHMWYGYVEGNHKFVDYYVWPVRSGQVSGSFDYYCDGDSDGYISSSVSGTCQGTGCVPAGCQTVVGDDCNDNNPAINPGAADSNCNGIDDNCNGTADENYVPTNTTCGIGACQSSGLLICQNGSTVDTCIAGSPTAETCNNLDDNCNGSVDEDVYVFGVFQQPINADGSSIFKAGSTIPVKIILTDCSGQSISTATVTIAVYKITDAILGTEEELLVESPGNANTGNLYRYDATKGQYIYNLSTKGYTQGTYKVYAKPNDGSSYSVMFSLKQ
ncbi:MAG: DUF1566 domain-containing protein [Thermodesulfovibrionia bacterium]|nr:DUF1566 domain-containing protein [Thermodesulfovibrionia bacterium]